MNFKDIKEGMRLEWVSDHGGCKKGKISIVGEKKPMISEFEIKGEDIMIIRKNCCEGCLKPISATLKDLLK